MDFLDELRSELHIDQLVEEIKAVRSELHSMGDDGPEYFTLVTACKRKGVSYNTVKSRKDLQPNGGVEDVRIGGRRYWYKGTIETWLIEVDQD
jgi:hypothetical protein